jgi:hypothetical protein
MPTRSRASVLATALLLAACGAEEGNADAPPAAAEGQDEAVFTAELTGDVEAQFSGSGSLRCIDLGDSGPGYLALRGSSASQTITFELPLEPETGTHELTGSVQVAASGQLPGDTYSVEISLPLEGFHRVLNAEGTLTLDQVGGSPGDLVEGSFDFRAQGAMSGNSAVKGSFRFRVGADARDRC